MKVIDCNAYRVNVPTIKSHLDDKTPEERMTMIGVLSLTTNAPIIVVACYVGELYGFNHELCTFIEVLKAFYHINNIVNVNVDGMIAEE